MLTNLDALLDAITEVNLAILPLPLAIAFHVIAFVVLMLMFFSPQQNAKQTNVIVKVWLGLSQLMVAAYVTGVALTFSGMDSIMLGSAAVVFVGFGIFTLFDIKRGSLDFSMQKRGLRQWLSLVVALVGIVIYPLVQMQMGLSYPRIVLYGAEVPTLLFLVGLFGAAQPSKSKIFMALLIVCAIQGIWIAVWAISDQVWFDALYGLNGILGLATLGYWISAQRK